ncbi:uncharacterized protein [Solanum lycopersicum]|uniref:uncharacterized protein n=1 Tax=Solanum lycopersicum TaxID=4081 RepID=UPI0037486D36
MKGVMRFGRQGKLSPRYIGPFEILRTVGEVAYELALPPEFSVIHPIFHVSMLRRYIPDESYVLQYDAIELDDHLTFVEEPVAIIARDVRKLRSRAIPIVKVRWRHRSIEKATWETEQEMREQFPGLFEPSDRSPGHSFGYCVSFSIFLELMNLERSFSIKISSQNPILTIPSVPKGSF